MTDTEHADATRVRRASLHDLDTCARVLTEAFADDPGTRNFEPDGERGAPSCRPSSAPLWLRR